MTAGVDYTADGMTYTVEYENDLTDPWNTDSVTAVGTPVDNGDGTGVRYRFTGAFFVLCAQDHANLRTPADFHCFSYLTK